MTNDTWKIYSASATFDTSNATLIGIAMMDDTNCIAARSFDFAKSYATTNTVRLVQDPTATVVQAQAESDLVIYGTVNQLKPGRLSWDMALDRDTGVSESADTTYFLYLDENADEIISDVAPYDRRDDLRGLYHPHQPWLCVGQIFNDESSDFTALIDYQNLAENNFVVTNKVASSALTVRAHASPLYKFKAAKDNQLETGIKDNAPILFEQTFTISSGSTLGHADGRESHSFVYGIVDSGHILLAMSTRLFRMDESLSTTAEGGAGAADSNLAAYSICCSNHETSCSISSLS